MMEEPVSCCGRTKDLLLHAAGKLVVQVVAAVAAVKLVGDCIKLTPELKWSQETSSK